MYQIKFLLKQHSPIIHFQHDQKGATLRATELKPKLDRFIMERLLDKENIPYDIYEDHVSEDGKVERKFITSRMAFKRAAKSKPNDSSNWVAMPKWKQFLVGKGHAEHVALDYRVQVTTDAEPTKFLVASYIPRFVKEDALRSGYQLMDGAPYFANNEQIKKGKFDEARPGLMLPSEARVSVVFSFLNSDVGEKIKENMVSFLCATNFGTRQGKGFGCFLPEWMDQVQFEEHLRDQFGQVYASPQARSLEQLFKMIEQEYKRLKSGDRGKDGELRIYFNNQRPPVEWEKPELLRALGDITRKGNRKYDQNKNHKFVRALLGLAEVYEFPHYDNVKARTKNTEIDRYASPLLFKIFKGFAYLLPNEKESLRRQVEGKVFQFEFSHRGRSYGSKAELKVPEDFDLKAFLAEAMRYNTKWERI
jgi:hypothetical protein